MALHVLLAKYIHSNTEFGQEVVDGTNFQLRIKQLFYHLSRIFLMACNESLNDRSTVEMWII